jgi:hypothetical protein
VIEVPGSCAAAQLVVSVGEGLWIVCLEGCQGLLSVECGYTYGWHVL